MTSFASKKHDEDVEFIQTQLEELNNRLKTLDSSSRKLPNLDSTDSELKNNLEQLDSELKEHLKKLSKKVKISITKNKESFDFMINANNEKIFVCSFTNNNGKVNIIPRVLLNTQKNETSEEDMKTHMKKLEHYRKRLIKLLKYEKSKPLSPKNKSKKGGKRLKKRTFRRKNKLIGGNHELLIASLITSCLMSLCIYSLVVNTNRDIIALSAVGVSATTVFAIFIVLIYRMLHNPDTQSETDSDTGSDTGSDTRGYFTTIMNNIMNNIGYISVAIGENVPIVLPDDAAVPIAEHAPEENPPTDYMESIRNTFNNIFNTVDTGLIFFLLINFIFNILPTQPDLQVGYNQENLPTSEPVQEPPHYVLPSNTILVPEDIEFELIIGTDADGVDYV
jgi:hypothetical protein